MAIDADHLLWIDLETTGLSHAEDEILEIGLILTDDQLRPLGELDLLVQPTAYGMARIASAPYVQKMHTENGLLAALAAAGDSLPEITVAGRQIVDWATDHGATRGRVAICGSGVAKFDYQFLERLTPELTDFCAYFVPYDSGILRRSYRTSTGTTLTTVDELKTHRGIDDIRCHLAESQMFRNLFRMAAHVLKQHPEIDLNDPNFDPAAALTDAGAIAPLSEAAARQILAGDGCPAADPARYEAVRCERGWAFYFRRESGPVLMGTSGYAVTDDGAARRLGVGMSIEGLVGREDAGGGRDRLGGSPR